MYVCVRASVSFGSVSLVGLVVVGHIACTYVARAARTCMDVCGIHTRVRFPFRDSRSRISKKMAAMKAYGGDVDVVHSKAASRPRKA